MRYFFMLVVAAVLIVFVFSFSQTSQANTDLKKIDACLYSREFGVQMNQHWLFLFYNGCPSTIYITEITHPLFRSCNIYYDRTTYYVSEVREFSLLGEFKQMIFVMCLDSRKRNRDTTYIHPHFNWH